MVKFFKEMSNDMIEKYTNFFISIGRCKCTTYNLKPFIKYDILVIENKKVHEKQSQIMLKNLSLVDISDRDRKKMLLLQILVIIFVCYVKILQFMIGFLIKLLKAS